MGGLDFSYCPANILTHGCHVIVPLGGQRLRSEFVYRTTVQLADEIRLRGKSTLAVAQTRIRALRLTD